jgi:hypothetical protein
MRCKLNLMSGSDWSCSSVSGPCVEQIAPGHLGKALEGQRYDKLGAAFLDFVQLAAVRIWLRSIEPTP